MVDVLAGDAALDALNQEDGGGQNEFTSFKSGSSYKVKVLGTADIISFFSYGIYGKLNSFVAENPSKKSKKGYPTEDLTPFDKAWKYHKDKSEDFNDKHGQEAGKYRCKPRFAMGFFDLDSGETIVVDLSKKQAQAIHAVIKKNEKKLGKKAFELSKTGKGQETVVSLMPEDLEDLTKKQQENFDKAPEEFDKSKFDGILFGKDEQDQVKALHEVGFDVTKIGYEVPKMDDEEGDEGVENGGMTDDEVEDSLPF